MPAIHLTRPKKGSRRAFIATSAMLMLLPLNVLTGCGSSGSGAASGTARPATAIATSAGTVAAGEQNYSLQWTADRVQRIVLEKPVAETGTSWLLVTIKISNSSGKTVSVKERQLKLTGDGQTIAADSSAITAAEKQEKVQGFGDILGTSIKAGGNETRSVVFKIPDTGKTFSLAIGDEKSAAALATPLILTEGVTAALSTPVAAAAAKPTAALPTATAGPQAYGPNTLVSVKNWDMAVAKIDKPGKDLVWSQYGNKSTAAGTWLVVVFDMKNTGNTNFGVNTSDFELRAANGVTYKVSDDLGAGYSYSEYKGGQQIGNQVPPGVNVTYYVTFDIAPDAANLQFIFKQDKKPVFNLSDPVAGGAPAASAPPVVTKPTTPPAAASSGAQGYDLNTLVSVKNWDMAVAKVELPGKELVWSQYGNKSVAAGTWLIVTFDMKNTGNTNFGVNTADFELRAANGVTYKVSSDFGAAYSYSEYKGGQSIGSQVPPGVNVTYYVAFDIAPDATGLQFAFKQDKKPVFNLGR